MPTLKQLFIALGFTIVTFGSSHLIVSYILMIARDYQEGNLFRILNYQKIFPGIDLGWQNFVISNAIAIGVYLVILTIVVRYMRKKAIKES